MDKIDSIRQWLGTGSINVFGIQFAGKDTVGKQLAQVFGAEFIGSGDVMRATFVDRTTATDQDVWRAAQVGSLSGSLMPTEEFKKMITERLSRADLDGESLVLSTIGRWIGEEGPVMDALNASGHPTKAVLLLQISEEEAWRRWKIAHDTRNGGRHDDIDEARVARRLAEFRDKTLPVIEIYRNMGILLEINAEQDRDKVFADVVDALYEFSRA